MTDRARLFTTVALATLMVTTAVGLGYGRAGRAGRESRPTLLGSTAADRDIPSERYYVALPGGDDESFTRAFHALDAAGAHHIHGFVPDLIVCQVPVSMDPAAVVNAPGAVIAREDDIDRLAGLDLHTRPASVRRTFETLRAMQERDAAQRSEPGERAAGYHGGEVRHIPEAAMYASRERADRINATLSSTATATTADARLIHQESELMIGTILINVVTPESDFVSPYWGENWSQESLYEVHQGLTMTMQKYMEELRNADINVIYRYFDQVPITDEPIWEEPNEDKFWIMLCMNQLGYVGAEADVLNNVHAFNDDARRRYGTDWAFSTFIVLAERKAALYGAKFENTRYLSWGYMGGPYWVTSYPADWFYGSSGLMQIARHEIGNIFWGLEEDINPQSECSDRSGYLDYINGNKVVAYDPYWGGREGCGPGLSPIACVMNEGDQIGSGWDAGPCDYTKGHWGVIDENENDVPDALDAPPVIEFSNADVETVVTAPDHFDVTVRALPIPNQNPMQPPELRRNYAAQIRDIHVAVGGLDEYTLFPKDLGSNGFDAEFQVPLPPLLPGRLDIVVRARNEYDARSVPRVKQFRYVHLKYLGFERTNPDEGIRLQWKLIGETFGARFAVHRRNLNTDDEVVLVDGIEPDVPPANGVTSFDFLDTTAEPGIDYDYWVTGTIDLPNSHGTIHKVVASKQVKARGALSRSTPTKRMVSNLAPNPFTTQTWMSLNVPHPVPTAPGGGGSVDETTRTEVQIEIFDVLGRRINTLYHDGVVDDVLTISWDGTDDRGRILPSGIYFVKVQVAGFKEVRKVMLLR